MGKLVNAKRNFANEPQPEQDATLKNFHLKSLAKITPQSENQAILMDAYLNSDDETFFIEGYPGTGKTFLACWLALNDILDETCRADKLVIFRSAVESRKIGYLPGTEAEKASVYEKPYHSVMQDAFNLKFSRLYDSMKKLGLVQFELSSNQRGVTYDNSIFVIDEGQNMTFEELDTIYTRSGKNCRILFCSDSAQNDLVHYKGQLSGLAKMKQILSGCESVSMHEFYELDDIVRSGRIRNYIESKIKLNMI